MSRTAALPALLVLIALAGCLGGSGPEASAAANQLQNESIKAMADVETYSIHSDIETSVSDRSVSLTLDGVVNRTAHRGHMTIHLSGPQEMSMEMYIDGQTAFVKLGDTWQQRSVPQTDLWNQSNRLAQQREIYAASTFEITGSGVIDGTPVTVVRITVPDDQLENLTTLAQQQSGIASGTITEAEYTAYISNETALTRRVVMEYSMQLEDRTVEGTVETTFDEFGMDPNITIPEAATEQRATITSPA